MSTGGSGADNPSQLLREQCSDATVTMWQSDPQVDSRLRQILASYVQNWYNLEFLDQRLCDSSAIVIVKEEDLEPLLSRLASTPGRRPALVVMCSVMSKHSSVLVRSLEERILSAVEFVSEPCGPHKLARSIRLALEKQSAIIARFSQVFNRRVILPTVELAQSSLASAEPESIVDDLADMDLNPPGRDR